MNLGQSPKNTASRRGFLKKTAATALAVGAGPAIIVPGRAEQKTLRILKWKNFVAEFDRWFNETFVEEWGAQNDTRVIVDSIGLGELSGRTAAEAKAQTGHDLVLLLTPASAFQDSVIDHREIFEESVRRYGQPLDVALKSCNDPRTGKHNGLCTSILPALITYRSDLWGEIGATPDSWDDVRRGGRKIRLLHDQPVGISLAPEHNSEHSLRAIMYSFGSSIQDGDGKPNLRSNQTLEVIKYTKALFEEAMPADVLGWNAVSNNQFMLSAEGCLTLDTLSIVRASESKRMPVADNLRLAMLPSGPVGRVGPSFGIDNFIIWKFSQNIDGAKNFLLDFIGASRDSTLVSGFQHLPSYPDAVTDLESLVTSDANAAVPDQYSLLKDVDDWVTNVGYPGFANPAVGEILSARLISKMFAAAATGELTPDEAMVQADQEVQRIFDRWRS
ncbi:ABC transporter substrate-binding protein [Gammaproteobacteria bacterium]|nr:ABC transporter substrate-binding protein [Gammaproteobacteria bacterium]